MRERLDEKAYGRSLTQLDRERFDYFVLVTNATITPRAARQTSDLLAQSGVEFVVIDEARLFGFLSATKLGHRLIAATTRPLLESRSEFVVEAQINKSQTNDEINLVVDLWLRNYTDRLLPVEMMLRADISWHSTLPSLRVCIDAGRDHLLRFQAKGASADNSEIVLAFRAGESEETLARIVAAEPELDFTPPLHGETHLRAVAEIRDALSQELPFLLINVTGEAGTGKSRVVGDAIALAANRTRKVYRALIDRSQPERSVRDLCTRVVKGLGIAGWRPDDTDKPGALLGRLLRGIDHPLFSIVIILEDLHHSSDEVIAELKNLLSHQPRPHGASVTLIITGRDDFTFPNQSYFTLLDLIATTAPSEGVKAIKLAPLTRTAARALVHSILEDVPPEVVTRVVNLSENVPFHLIQIVEHLLEAGIAKLRRSNRAGIPNPFRFGQLIALPVSMREIYLARVNSLRASPNGEPAWLFLSIATFFGQAIPDDLDVQLFGTQQGSAAAGLLLSRRFLLRSIEGGFEWGHENWLHFVRSQVENTGTTQALARQILETDGLRSRFAGLELGRLYALAGEPADALTCYEPAIAAARMVQNLSAADIDAVYFDHLPHVYRSLRAVGRAIDDQISTLVAYAYLGNHAISGPQGLSAVLWARQEVEGISLPGAIGGITRARLRQVENHALMETGELGRAERQLLELAMQVQINPALTDAFDVKFDLYNRLQDVYRFRNHLQLAEDFGVLAHQAAERLGKEACVVSLIDSAVVYRYVDTERCLRLHEEALVVAASYGIERNIICGRIAWIAARLSLVWNESSGIEPLLDELKAMLETCIRRPYAPFIARCHLLVAVCHYLLSLDDASHLQPAQAHTEGGIDAAIRYRSGFDIWQLYNLQIIIATRGKESPRRIDRLFNAAIGDLRASNMLSFGNLDVCFENILVASNYVRYLHRAGHKTPLREFLREIKFYENTDRDITAITQRAVGSVERNHVLFQEKPLASVIIDKETGYCIAAPS